MHGAWKQTRRQPVVYDGLHWQSQILHQRMRATWALTLCLPENNVSAGAADIIACTPWISDPCLSWPIRCAEISPTRHASTQYPTRVLLFVTESSSITAAKVNMSSARVRLGCELLFFVVLWESASMGGNVAALLTYCLLSQTHTGNLWTLCKPSLLVKKGSQCKKTVLAN